MSDLPAALVDDPDALTGAGALTLYVALREWRPPVPPGGDAIPYVEVTPKKAKDRVSKLTWRTAGGGSEVRVHLLDVVDPVGGQFSDVECKNNTITATLTRNQVQDEATYGLLVWTREQGLCMAYGGPPARAPECLADPRVRGPQPPPKIEPPDGIQAEVSDRQDGTAARPADGPAEGGPGANGSEVRVFLRKDRDGVEFAWVLPKRLNRRAETVVWTTDEPDLELLGVGQDLGAAFTNVTHHGPQRMSATVVTVPNVQRIAYRLEVRIRGARACLAYGSPPPQKAPCYAPGEKAPGPQPPPKLEPPGGGALPLDPTGD